MVAATYKKEGVQVPSRQWENPTFDLSEGLQDYTEWVRRLRELCALEGLGELWVKIKQESSVEDLVAGLWQTQTPQNRDLKERKLLPFCKRNPREVANAFHAVEMGSFR